MKYPRLAAPRTSMISVRRRGVSQNCHDPSMSRRKLDQRFGLCSGQARRLCSGQVRRLCSGQARRARSDLCSGQVRGGRGDLVSDQVPRPGIRLVSNSARGLPKPVLQVFGDGEREGLRAPSRGEMRPSAAKRSRIERATVHRESSGPRVHRADSSGPPGRRRRRPGPRPRRGESRDSPGTGVVPRTATPRSTGSVGRLSAPCRCQ